MELTELNPLEQNLLRELYCSEMDSAAPVMTTEDLVVILKVDPVDLRLAFRKMAMKGLLLGQTLTVRGKTFIEESGILPIDRWMEVQATREAISICIVEVMVEEGYTESLNIDNLVSRLPIKPCVFDFNIDVMTERGFLTILRGNRVALGPRLRALVGK